MSPTLAAKHRGIGMVFQHYALFPNMTVEQNLAFGLEQQKLPDAGDRSPTRRRDDRTHGARRTRQGAAVGSVRRAEAACRPGPRPRACEPKLLLLDEPMSALDAQIRKRLREELKRLQVDLGFTAIFVTHDQEEALVLGDRIAVMQSGRFSQVGTPCEIYNRPASRAVARFIGDFNVLEPADVERVFGRRTMRAWAIHPEGLALRTDGVLSAGDPSAEGDRAVGTADGCDGALRGRDTGPAAQGGRAESARRKPDRAGNGSEHDPGERAHPGAGQLNIASRAGNGRAP